MVVATLRKARPRLEANYPRLSLPDSPSVPILHTRARIRQKTDLCSCAAPYCKWSNLFLDSKCFRKKKITRDSHEAIRCWATATYSSAYQLQLFHQRPGNHRMTLTTWKVLLRRSDQVGYHYVTTLHRASEPIAGEDIALGVVVIPYTELESTFARTSRVGREWMRLQLWRTKLSPK
jgi:hypothetical protein